jgi:RNA recognition motif-containing protein
LIDKLLNCIEIFRSRQKLQQPKMEKKDRDSKQPYKDKASNVWYSDKVYNPLTAGSIDGTDSVPHDKALIRASQKKCLVPTILIHSDDAEKDSQINGNPYKTLFIGRLSKETTEETIRKYFSEFGRITHLRLVRDIGIIWKPSDP